MKSIIVICIVLVCGLMAIVWASTTGYGVRQPRKEPVSLREGSRRGQRSAHSRHHGPRYFIGGGHRYGK